MDCSTWALALCFLVGLANGRQWKRREGGVERGLAIYLPLSLHALPQFWKILSLWLELLLVGSKNGILSLCSCRCRGSDGSCLLCRLYLDASAFLVVSLNSAHSAANNLFIKLFSVKALSMPMLGSWPVHTHSSEDICFLLLDAEHS